MSPGRGPRPAWTVRYLAALLVGDFAAAALASAIAIAVTDAWGLPVWDGLAVVQAFMFVLLVALNRGYDASRFAIGGDELRAPMRAAGAGFATAAGWTVFTRDPDRLTEIVVAAVLVVPLALLVRFAARRWLARQRRHGMHLSPTLVVGPLEHVQLLAARLEAEHYSGMKVIGVCVPEHEAAEALAAGLDVVGGLDDVRAAALSRRAGTVVVTNGLSPEFLRGVAWSLEDVNAELLVHPGLMEVAGPRMTIRPFIGLPLVSVEQPRFAGLRFSAKRVTDVVIGSIGMLVAAPVMALIALAIKLDDGGPVFFRQTRVGRDGDTFEMIKFRSMCVDAEARKAELEALNEGAGPLFKMTGDPRITRVGRLLRKTSLDELPQLFNIMAGTMAVVGPRPPLPSEVAAYDAPVHRRLLVPPGLTGLWQVSGRSSLSWEESVRLDLRYVENWSMATDLLIMWKTVGAVLARRGAY